MYTIKYSEKEKSLPTFKKVNFRKIFNRRVAVIMERHYARTVDMETKCLNIESVTIDLDDIRYSAYDRYMYRVNTLRRRLERRGTNGVGQITILNNNPDNKKYIYEIITSPWMVNKDSVVDLDEEIKNAEEGLKSLLICYNKAKEKNNVFSISYYFYKIELMKYYILSLAAKRNGNSCAEESCKTLKLGERFKEVSTK